MALVRTLEVEAREKYGCLGWGLGVVGGRSGGAIIPMFMNPISRLNMFPNIPCIAPLFVSNPAGYISCEICVNPFSVREGAAGESVGFEWALYKSAEFFLEVWVTSLVTAVPAFAFRALNLTTAPPVVEPMVTGRGVAWE